MVPYDNDEQLIYNVYPYQYVEREDEVLDGKANFWTIAESKSDPTLLYYGRGTDCATTLLHSPLIRTYAPLNSNQS